MCKIMCLAGITDETRKDALSLIKVMGDKMSIHPNNDGIGYAALGTDGKLFGERWKYNREFLNRASTISKEHKETRKMFKKFFVSMTDAATDYNTFGELNLDNFAAITLHARNATSGREFKNTHPFVEGTTSLIHNGVIRNTDELTMKTSTCDSETILHEYIKCDVPNNPKDIQMVADKLEGYYACGVFARNNKQVPVLDIFKSEAAGLFSGYVKELKTFVITTMYGDLEDSCKQLGLTLEGRYMCQTGVLTRLNPMTGEVLLSVEFAPEYKNKKPASNLTVVGTDEVEDHGNWLYYKKEKVWAQKAQKA